MCDRIPMINRADGPLRGHGSINRNPAANSVLVEYDGELGYIAGVTGHHIMARPRIDAPMIKLPADCPRETFAKRNVYRRFELSTPH